MSSRKRQRALAYVHLILSLIDCLASIECRIELLTCRRCNLAGEYPASLEDALLQVHVSGDPDASDDRSIPIEKGNPTGLYHLMVGEGQNAFVAHGLSHLLTSHRWSLLTLSQALVEQVY